MSLFDSKRAREITGGFRMSGEAKDCVKPLINLACLRARKTPRLAHGGATQRELHEFA
jgi:hypothetical protein